MSGYLFRNQKFCSGEAIVLTCDSCIGTTSFYYQLIHRTLTSDRIIVYWDRHMVTTGPFKILDLWIIGHGPLLLNTDRLWSCWILLMLFGSSLICRETGNTEAQSMLIWLCTLWMEAFKWGNYKLSSHQTIQHQY